VVESIGTKRTVWLFATAVLVLVTMWMIFEWVPTERNLGVVQRALYVHVPLAWISMVAVGVVAAASLMYLITGKRRWDSIALASAETGVLAGTLMLVTGAIWAKPIWNVWWTWDAKLTTTAILWFFYVAYLMLRAFAPPGNQAYRMAAVVAVLGAVDVPIVYYAADLWRTAHPELIIGPAADSSGLTSEMGLTLLVSVVAFTSLYIYMLVDRYRVRQSELEISDLKREMRNYLYAPSTSDVPATAQSLRAAAAEPIGD